VFYRNSGASDFGKQQEQEQSGVALLSGVTLDLTALPGARCGTN
jgi:hypothetical protein